MLPNDELAGEYHRNLPQRIRDYLWAERCIPDTTIDKFQLGWNGLRITIPIRNRQEEVALFKLAKGPRDTTDSPKMIASPGGHAELYGWEHARESLEQIIICEGEFDRLVLESRGFPTVTSTGGAGTFRPEWAEAFRDIPNVYICFDNDEAGRAGAERVAQLIPQARIARLPNEVGEGGDITDFFVRLGKSREEFLRLLDQAERPPLRQAVAKADTAFQPQPTGNGLVEQVKSQVQIEDIVGRYLTLRRRGQTLVARCPFHQDRNPSFAVYPASQSFYCFGCQAHGDVIKFLMLSEHLTFGEALRVLRELTGFHD